MITHIPGNLVACICEGNAEKEIISMLLDNDCLIFDREELVNGEPLGRHFRSAKKFERQFASMVYEEKIEVIRILDSKTENFSLSEGFNEKLEFVENCYTTPEIEILYIIKENCFPQFKKSGLKPSDFCKENLKMGKNIKSNGYCSSYFKDINELIASVVNYNSVKPNKDLYSIYDLLKPQFKG